jgi:WYL_2, Sm-like SH3 beta-barrel fold
MLDNKDINRSNLLKLLLQEEYLKILFKKSTTQTMRTMICTLYGNSIPTSFAKSIEATIKQNDNLDILPVWDVIKGKWRSFHISNIISVDIMEKKN